MKIAGIQLNKPTFSELTRTSAFYVGVWGLLCAVGVIHSKTDAIRCLVAAMCGAVLLACGVRPSSGLRAMLFFFLCVMIGVTVCDIVFALLGIPPR